MPEIGISCCIIHRHTQVVKKLPLKLQNVTSEAIKIVNFIKFKPMNSQFFTVLCEEMGSHHTEIRQLSQGKVLIQLCTLQNDVMLLLCEFSFNLTS